METQTPKRNSHPTPASSLPTITLVVLIMTIIALLYIGYEYVADNTDGSEELTNVALDTTVQNPVQAPIEPELVAPMEIDTSSRNAPVDQSLAAAPSQDEQEKEDKSQPPAPDSEVRTPVGRTVNESDDDEVKNAQPNAEKPDVEKPKEEKPVAEKPKEVTPKKEEKPKEEKKETPKLPAGSSMYTHTVRKGETIYSIASKYNVSINTLKAMNPDLENNAVKSDVTKLKVKVRAVHTVGPGDVLRVVAEKYGVSKEALMKANGKTKDFAQRGERLIIPYAEKQ